MVTADALLGAIADTARATGAPRPWAYATVDPSYTTGLPKLTFDGEGALSTKGYPYVASYTPVANHRVLVLLDGPTALVLGRVVNS